MDKELKELRQAIKMELIDELINRVNCEIKNFGLMLSDVSAKDTEFYVKTIKNLGYVRQYLKSLKKERDAANE